MRILAASKPQDIEAALLSSFIGIDTKVMPEIY